MLSMILCALHAMHIHARLWRGLAGNTRTAVANRSWQLQPPVAPQPGNIRDHNLLPQVLQRSIRYVGAGLINQDDLAGEAGLYLWHILGLAVLNAEDEATCGTPRHAIKVQRLDAR